MFLIKLLHMPFCAVVVTKDKSMLDKLPSEQTNRFVRRQREGREGNRQTDDRNRKIDGAIDGQMER